MEIQKTGGEMGYHWGSFNMWLPLSFKWKRRKKDFSAVIHVLLVAPSTKMSTLWTGIGMIQASLRTSQTQLMRDGCLWWLDLLVLGKSWHQSLPWPQCPSWNQVTWPAPPNISQITPVLTDLTLTTLPSRLLTGLSNAITLPHSTLHQKKSLTWKYDLVIVHMCLKLFISFS